MARTKGSSTLAKLQAAYGNQENIEDAPKKRVRRTKVQLIADGYYDNKDKKSNSTSAKQKNADNGNVFKFHSMTADELSDKLIADAKEHGEENWEHDFRNDYEKGQKIYYVEINERCKSKEILELYVSTVYSKFIVAFVDCGEAHNIGIEDADKIFLTEADAKKCYKEVKC